MKFIIHNLTKTFFQIEVPGHKEPLTVVAGGYAGPFESKDGPGKMLKLAERNGRVRIEYIKDEPAPKPAEKEKKLSKEEESDKS